jgi:hypothetical protein
MHISSLKESNYQRKKRHIRTVSAAGHCEDSVPPQKWRAGEQAAAQPQQEIATGGSDNAAATGSGAEASGSQKPAVAEVTTVPSVFTFRARSPMKLLCCPLAQACPPPPACPGRLPACSVPLVSKYLCFKVSVFQSIWGLVCFICQMFPSLLAQHSHDVQCAINESTSIRRPQDQKIFHHLLSNHVHSGLDNPKLDSPTIRNSIT